MKNTKLTMQLKLSDFPFELNQEMKLICKKEKKRMNELGAELIRFALLTRKPK